jgi:hypothetical protein
MKIKEYPEVDYDFFYIDGPMQSNIRLKFYSIVTTRSGEKLDVRELFEYHTNTNHIKDIPKIIEFTNRFHQMCQKYINEYKSE